MKKLPLLFLSIITNFLFAQNQNTPDTKRTVTTKSEFSYKMLEQNQDLRKIKLLLEERKAEEFTPKSLIIGASIIGITDYQKSSSNSKFGYLMRHPTAKNQIGKEVSEATLHSFQLSVTGIVNNWITLCTDILYNPQQSFGGGTNTSLNRNQIQLRKAAIVFGDLNKSPLYVAIGKMDTPFSQTGSVNPFSNSTTWHVFGGLAYGAQLGYKKGGMHAVFMAAQGGAQFRLLNTPVGLEKTSVPSKLNNFVADVNYTFSLTQKTDWLLGVSYVRGTTYAQKFPVTHFSPCYKNNPAGSVYTKIKYKDRFVFKSEFIKTEFTLRGAHNPYPPLNKFFGTQVASLALGGKYFFNMDKKIKYATSLEYSRFRTGTVGAPWERQNQIILGLSGFINKTSKLFVEFFRTEGYVPFNFISGSKPFEPFPPGVTHSERNAFTFGGIIGAQITI